MMLRCHQLVLFVLLSLADFALTWALIEHQGEGIYEGNPVARWWLAAYGWPGLFIFKAAAVSAAVGLAVIIARHRPRLGDHVLHFGCAALAATLVYSGTLAIVRRASSDEFALPNVVADPDHVEFLQLLGQLRRDVGSGRCSLRDAARALEETAWAKKPEFSHARRLAYPGRPEGECFGAIVVVSIVSVLKETDPQARPTADRLLGEFEATYQTAAPWSREELLKRTVQELELPTRLSSRPSRPRWRHF
jgi:hypothetical protein